MIARILYGAFNCRLTTSFRLHHACVAAGPVIDRAWFHEDCGGAIVAGAAPAGRVIQEFYSNTCSTCCATCLICSSVNSG